MNEIAPKAPLAAKDYASDQEVRWCPGCGDYAILKAVQKTCADLALDPAQTVFISGIGCAARLPYYMATYGFHTIHGRAPAIATGIKLANPGLDVWLITGDGDSLSIGGNHLMHALRRNVDINILLFNNRIYGLTKGQYSPTSERGKVTKSTPLGSIDHPVSALTFALGAGARFIARGVDTQQKVLPETMKRAHAHKGASLVEILQNCIVYNDNAFSHFTDKGVAADQQVHVAHGKPLTFGGDAKTGPTKGLRLDVKTLTLEVVPLGEGGTVPPDILVHDETNRVLAGMLAAMQPPALPIALGVLYCNPEPAYDIQVADQMKAAVQDGAWPGPIRGNLDDLLRSGHTWEVA